MTGPSVSGWLERQGDEENRGAAGDLIIIKKIKGRGYLASTPLKTNVPESIKEDRRNIPLVIVFFRFFFCVQSINISKKLMIWDP